MGHESPSSSTVGHLSELRLEANDMPDAMDSSAVLSVGVPVTDSSSAGSSSAKPPTWVEDRGTLGICGMSSTNVFGALRWLEGTPTVDSSVSLTVSAIEFLFAVVSSGRTE